MLKDVEGLNKNRKEEYKKETNAKNGCLSAVDGVRSLSRDCLARHFPCCTFGPAGLRTRTTPSVLGLRSHTPSVLGKRSDGQTVTFVILCASVLFLRMRVPDNWCSKDTGWSSASLDC